ncbi:MAG TPA: DUF1579 family protein [Planctomycetia bacterium]|nr:DUF1579 family protein [Planctomycetia bacterium]
MNPIERLAAAAGEWTGRNILQDPHSGLPDETAATAAIVPIIGGRFVRIDYTWSYRGQPQSGCLILGHDGVAATGCWMDSWHMGRVAMLCRGEPGPEDRLSLFGTYPAPPDPDWGWRTSIYADEAKFGFMMDNVDPAGNASLAVTAEFERAG